jgi:hypothetical protein
MAKLLLVPNGLSDLNSAVKLRSSPEVLSLGTSSKAAMSLIEYLSNANEAKKG